MQSCEVVILSQCMTLYMHVLLFIEICYILQLTMWIGEQLIPENEIGA